MKSANVPEGLIFQPKIWLGNYLIYLCNELEVAAIDIFKLYVLLISDKLALFGTDNNNNKSFLLYVVQTRSMSKCGWRVGHFIKDKQY